MTLLDAVKSFGPKITENYRETRFCDFAPPDETVGVIDVSASGNGSRGIAFLIDSMIVKLDGAARRIDYRDIRVMETLPSYETPFEDELLIASPAGDIRISDCSMNKFFLRQLISNMSRISLRMTDSDREALNEVLTSDALDHYAEQLFSEPEPPRTEVRVEAAAAVPEIARAKKAALADLQPKLIDIPEEVEWLSTPHVSRQSETLNPAESEEPEKTPAPEPQNQPERLDQADPVTPAAEPVSLTEPRQRDEDISDMSHEETMSYLLDSIAEINSTPEPENAAQPVESPAAPAQPEESRAVSGEPAKTEAVQSETSEPPEPVEIPAIPPLTKEPNSPDIYIQASSRIRGLIEDGRLTMEQVSTAVREQLVEASEVYSGLDIENAQLPEAVKKRARQLDSAADRLPEYFTLGEDIAARVMFFMLYQMLSYTDRVVQSDMTKQKLNYFFVRFGAAGMVLSMLDANN